MKKITADFHKQMEVKIPKTKTITAKVEGEEYEIVIKNLLSIEEKTELVKDSLKLMQVEVELSEITGGTLLLMVIYKALTDIEFPEKLEDQVAQFTWLLDTGILKEVSDNIRPGLIQELSDFLILSLGEVQSLAEKEIAKAKEEKAAE